MKNKEIKIFIAAHKKFNEPKNDIYIPLHVGAKGKQNLGYLKDSTKKNISDKNPFFCELTGLYWIWKNINADIVGLVHYRRYFYNSIFSKKSNILTEKDINKILSKNDIIISNRGYTWGSTVREQYDKYHIISDLDKCEMIIKEKYPDYIEAYNKVINGNNYSPFNMIITKKNIFDDYCEWLFDILFELEKTLDLSNRDKYNARVYGFLSERLLNVWLLKNSKYKVIEQYVFNNEENVFRQKLEAIIKKIIGKV